VHRGPTSEGFNHREIEQVLAARLRLGEQVDAVATSILKLSEQSQISSFRRSRIPTA